MFSLWCCGLCDESVEMNRASENQSQILDGPVIIGPLPENFGTVPFFFVSAERRNASDEQVDMHNALDERITSREYILSITDDEFSRFPVAFIELFPGEIMQLEQRLCDLKTGISSSERRPEPLSMESENFLKSYHSQITIYADAGFQNMAKKMGFHTPLQNQQLSLSLSDPANS